jgi:pimeloyl-ACP methyl ester carboxylesterase
MGRVRLRSLSLHVRDEGSGAPVLLLHGFPASGELWDGVAPLLAGAGFRVLVPDLAGYGQSDAPEHGIDMAAQAGFIVELLDVLGIRRAAVVAHDVGTAAAQILAARAPERLRALALIDGVCGDEWAMEWVASIRDFDESKADRLARVLARTLREPGLAPEAVRPMLAHWDGNDGGLRLIRAARALDPSQTAGIAERVRAARIPSLVLWGEEDRYLRAAEVGEPLAFLLGAELKVLPGGHFLPLAAPSAVARELVPFLSALPE